MYPNEFAKNMVYWAEKQIPINKKKGLPTENLKEVVKYGTPQSKKEEKLIADAPKKAAKAKNVSKPDALRYTSDPEAPSIEDENQRAWLMGLGRRAEKSTGRVFDSNQYKDFLKQAKIVSDLAAYIDNTSRLYPSDSATFGTRTFEKNTKRMFGNRESVTFGEIKEAYKRAWGDLVTNAKRYEEFKIQTEGFTRDVNNRDHHQLKSRSKLKFSLMDEMFYPEKRKIPQKDNQIKM